VVTVPVPVPVAAGAATASASGRLAVRGRWSAGGSCISVAGRGGSINHVFIVSNADCFALE
jgi:hypothetical protein